MVSTNNILIISLQVITHINSIVFEAEQVVLFSLDKWDIWLKLIKSWFKYSSSDYILRHVKDGQAKTEKRANELSTQKNVCM